MANEGCRGASSINLNRGGRGGGELRLRLTSRLRFRLSGVLRENQSERLKQNSQRTRRLRGEAYGP